MVQITFEGPVHELEPFDRSTAKILTVRAERGSEPVAAEDDYPAHQQHAHTTAHTVLTQMLTRDLPGRNWAQAWTLLKNRYLFLEKLLTDWYKITTPVAKVNKTNMAGTTKLIKDGIERCNKALHRDTHSITEPLWGVRPKDGDHKSWKWRNRDPIAEGIDTSKHLVSKWQPSLMSDEVKKLEKECEEWIYARSRFPWTSVKSVSYISGDAAGPDAVEKAAKSVPKVTNPATIDINPLGETIVRKFDFFPRSITKARTVEHAAALAARHLVEHLQYHASIDPAWYPSVKTAFFLSWESKIKQEVGTEKAKTRAARMQAERSKGKVKGQRLEAGRDTTGLEDLLADWTKVTEAFNRSYALFVTSIVRS